MSIFLLNERRSRINEIEERTDVRVIVVSDPTRSDNRFEVTRLRSDDKKNKDHASYEIQSEIESSGNGSNNYKKPKFEKPAVNLTPPKKPKKKGASIFQRLFKLFESPDAENKRPSKTNNRNRRRADNRRRRSDSKNNKNVTKNRNQRPKRNVQSSQNKQSDKRTNKQSDKPKDLKSKSIKAVKSEKTDKNKSTRKPANQTKKVKSQNINQKNDLQKESKSKATKLLTEEAPVANKEPRKPNKENNQINEPKTSIKEADNITKTNKKAKDWGRASNDPRNKS